MTPLEQILITTPKATPTQELRAQITTLRKGVRALVSARMPLRRAIEEIERQYILAAIEDVGGNHSKAARVLRIHRNTITRKLGSQARKKQPSSATAAELTYRNGSY